MSHVARITMHTAPLRLDRPRHDGQDAQAAGEGGWLMRDAYITMYA